MVTVMMMMMMKMMGMRGVSELLRSRKKQLLGKISTQMSKLAGERGTGVVNIAASLIARFQIIISI